MENKKNSRQDVPSIAVVSPPAKKTKVDIIADAVDATSATSTWQPKEYKLDRHSCEEYVLSLLDLTIRYIRPRYA